LADEGIPISRLLLYQNVQVPQLSRVCLILLALECRRKAREFGIFYVNYLSPDHVQVVPLFVI